MPTFTLEESADGDAATPILPDGTVVVVEVTGVRERQMNYTDDNGNPVIRLGFEFVCIEGPHRGARFQQDVYWEFNTSARCRLYMWTLELFGVDHLDPNFRLDTDDLVGKRASAKLGIREWTRPNGDAGRRNTVKWLNRLPAGSGPVTAPVSAGSQSQPNFPAQNFPPLGRPGADEEPF